MIENEAALQALDHAMYAAELLILGYCLYRLVRPFMRSKRKAAEVGAVYALSMLALFVIPLSLSAFAAYAVGTLISFLVMCLTDRRNQEQKVFLAVTFFSLRWFAFAAAEILYDNLYVFAENTNYMKRHLHMWFALYVGIRIVYLTLGVLFMAIGIRCILKAYTHKYAPMTKSELLVMAVPSFVGVAGYQIIGYYRIFYVVESGKLPGIYDMLALLYDAAAMIAVVLVIILYQGIQAQKEEKLQNELLAVQIDRIGRHMEQVEELYRDIRRTRHDMTNHILTLERLYAGNHVREARAYGAELKAAFSHTAGETQSGNPVTDVILQETKREAEKRKIRFCSDFSFPSDSKVNAFDVSVILNNALQNALENAGTGEEAYVSVRSWRRKQAYMIEIKNSFRGELQWDAESGLPLTAKETEGHGYGLSNIRRVAEKYLGDIDIEQKDGEFCLSIMLMLEESAERPES